MSLQYLSGVGEIGRNRKAKRQAKKQARKVRKGKAAPSESEESEESPVNESRIKKSRVQKRIRSAFKKKGEPISVKDEDIAEQPETTNEVEETEQAESNEQQNEGDGESMGIIYPHTTYKRVRHPHTTYKHVRHHRTKHSIGKLKLKGKLKAKIKKAVDRRKNDKHKPAEKAAHMFAKPAMLIPRGAFLAVLLLGKALEKTPIKINLAKKIKDAWKTKGKQFSELWYKVGGEPDILKAQIEKATSSKLSGEMGYVVAAATGGSVASASPIILKIMKVLGKAKEFADKNPKLIAAGQAIAKKGIEAAAKKNPSKYNQALKVADEITSVLPPETQAKINEIRKNLPDKLVKGVEVKAEQEIADIKAAINQETPTNSQKGLLIAAGAAALVGGYLLMKKKK